MGGTGVPETESEAPRPSPSSRPDGATRRTPGGDREGSRTPLTWSSRNSNRWALKLSTWKSQFCIKPSKLPSSTSTRSPSWRPWPSRSQRRTLRTTEALGAGRSPNPPGRQGGDRRQLRGAPSGSSRRRSRGRSTRSPQGAGRERTRRARRRGGLGAPGRRAGRSSDGRLPCGSRVPGAGCREGARPGHKGRKTTRAGGGRCAPSGPPRTIDPGGRAAARARGRRVGAVPCPGARGAERRGAPPGARDPPLSSQLPARGAGRRGSVPATGAGRARAFVCGEGAGTLSARSSELRPASPSPPRRVSATGPLSEHYKRGAPPRTAQPIGPPPSSRAPVGRPARPSSAPARHWAPRGGAPADR